MWQLQSVVESATTQRGTPRPKPRAVAAQQGLTATQLKAKKEAEARAAEAEVAGAFDASKYALEKSTGMSLSADNTKALRFLQDQAGGPMAAVQQTTSFAQRIQTAIVGAWAAFMAQSATAKVIQIIAVIGVIVLVLYMAGFIRIPAKQTTVVTTAGDTLAASVQGFQNPGPPAPAASPAAAPTELKLLNAQPLTIKQAAYMGPPDGGSFDPELAVSQALRAGFRSFVLQIDYLDTIQDKDKFPAPGEPTLLYRDARGALLSANAGSLAAAATAFANAAFKAETPNNTQPLLLYLHLNRAPSPTRQRDRYIRYLSKIAAALAPLAPNHLGMTPLGIFHRQRQEDVLLTSPLSSFAGQVIIMSNADTSIFRTGTSDGKKYLPAEDLDYWVNLRVYLDDDNSNIGVTKIPEEGVTANAVVVYLSQVLALSAAKSDSFATRGKRRFVIAMPDPLKNPTVPALDKALNELGINMVPLDIFQEDLNAVKQLRDLYDAKSYRAKPAALQHSPPLV